MRLHLVTVTCVLGAAGCSFPEVTFATAPPDAGADTTSTFDATSPDLDSASSDDADTDVAVTPIGDAGSDALPLPDGACDFTGTWGSRVTIPVMWTPQGVTAVVLSSGTGQIRQWVRGIRTQTNTPSGTALTDDTSVCGIELPDFKTNGVLMLGAETYGIRFPDSLFDDTNKYIPSFTVNGGLNNGLGIGATYSTTTSSVLLGVHGITATDPWPATIPLPYSSASMSQVDMDQDGKVGVTAGTAQGTSDAGVAYANPPVEIPAAPLAQPARASAVYLAIRQVTIVSATVQDCRTMAGTAQTPQINSHVLGCALAGGGSCTPSQASFLDNTQPIFTPTGQAKFESIRFAKDATCDDVRHMLP